ncbi:TPA: hypothetical protein ACH3X3_000509 [Trebouxia sp. C0006]
MKVAHARSQLLAAINTCHPSPTARWLRQAAAACLHYGLHASQTGLQLMAVDCSMVVEDVTTVCPDITDLMLKLQGKAGSKYSLWCHPRTNQQLCLSTFMPSFCQASKNLSQLY